MTHCTHVVVEINEADTHEVADINTEYIMLNETEASCRITTV